MTGSIENIPFHLPSLSDREAEAAACAVRRGCLTGDGEIGRRVEGKLRERLGVDHVLLVTSCTHALEMSMLALEIGPPAAPGEPGIERAD